VGAIACVSLLAASGAWAQEIRFADETSLTADVLQTDDESVIVRLPRSGIATIDGYPLPPVLAAGAGAPSFTAADLQGQVHSVGADSGKVTVLHFWVSWCPHCQSDAPKIQALHDQFKDHPAVRVLTVNLDQERAQLDAFVKERGVTYPVIVASEQALQGVGLPELYQVTGFPVTYLIDTQGVIRHKISGSFVEQGLDLAAKVAEQLPQTDATTAAAPADAGAQLAQAGSCGCGCAMKGNCCGGEPGACGDTQETP